MSTWPVNTSANSTGGPGRRPSLAFRVSIVHVKPDVNMPDWQRKWQRWAVFKIFDAVLHTYWCPWGGSNAFLWECSCASPADREGSPGQPGLHDYKTKQALKNKACCSRPAPITATNMGSLWLFKQKTLCVKIKMSPAHQLTGRVTRYILEFCYRI